MKGWRFDEEVLIELTERADPELPPWLRGLHKPLYPFLGNFGTGMPLPDTNRAARGGNWYTGEVMTLALQFVLESSTQQILTRIAVGVEGILLQLKEHNKHMADGAQALADLKAGVADVGTTVADGIASLKDAVVAEITAVEKKIADLSTPSGIAPADAEGVVADLATLKTNVAAGFGSVIQTLNDETAKLGLSAGGNGGGAPPQP